MCTTVHSYLNSLLELTFQSGGIASMLPTRCLQSLRCQREAYPWLSGLRSQISDLIPFGVPLAAVGARQIPDDDALLAVDGHVLYLLVLCAQVGCLGAAPLSSRARGTRSAASSRSPSRT